jgi:hypothetical protein
MHLLCGVSLLCQVAILLGASLAMVQILGQTFVEEMKFV